MFNGPGNLGCISALNCHVRNKVRYHTHLLLLIAWRNGVVVNLILLGIKPLHVLEWLLVLDKVFVVGYDKHSIPVEVGTRQAFCNSSVNPDSILGGIGDQPLAFRIAVIDLKDRNLETTTMGVADQSHLFSITKTRGVDLSVLEGVNRKDHGRFGTGQRFGFKIHSSRVCSVSKADKELLPDSGILKATDLC